MEKKRKQIALVTGASSGMGRCFVRQIAATYPLLQEIWVIARREKALRELKTEAEQKSGRGRPEIRILPLDLSRKHSFSELELLLAKEKPRLRLLVNGAGVGQNGPVEKQGADGICAMTDVNCRALTLVTRLCLPYMERGSRILELASGSAFLPQPGFAVYAASKAYVLSFSRALREEVKKRGISVTAVCPGPVDTAFFQAGGIRLSPVKRRFLADADRVVEKALRDARKRKCLSIYGISMKLVYMASAVLPEGMLVKISAALLR